VHEDDSVTFDPPMSRPNGYVDRKPTGFDAVVLEP
jgi:hypothetical protein